MKWQTGLLLNPAIPITNQMTIFFLMTTTVASLELPETEIAQISCIS